MRFSTTVISLASLVLGTNAQLDPGYIPTWDLVVDARRHLGSKATAEVQLENGQMYIRNATNLSPSGNPVLRYQLVATVNRSGDVISAAKLVGYPDYTAADEDLYMWQEGGAFLYGPFGESPVNLGSWWLTPGPLNDRQLRLTLDGNSTAKALWNESTLRYDFFIGSGIPTDHVQDMFDIELKVTKYCGPGVTDFCP